MTRPQTISLVSAARAFKGLSHQIAALNALEQQLTPEQLHDFAELYRADPTPIKPPPPPPPIALEKRLAVPWYAQLDSTTDQGRRMCFSSSCAMLLAYLKPGALSGGNGDDQFLRRVQSYGDTTDPKAQLRALSSFGVSAQFTTKADFTTIEQQINRGIPVPCGYLHRGHITAPAGGGHWLCVVGYNATHVLVHDPLGEADLITGSTLDRPARFTPYSRKNFGRRWMVEGPGTGWAILA